MSSTSDISVKFWGVRGSIACSGPGTVVYGGSTSCIEVLCDEHRVIFDAGTGIRLLGASFEPGAPVDADILLSHTHLDHVVGLPFFAPAYTPSSHLRLWAGHLLPDLDLEDVLCTMMAAPLFPVPMGVMGAEKVFNNFHAGDTFELNCGATVRTCPPNHPNGATGYRIEYGGGSICYVTDTEHVEGTHDENILALIDGADIFIYDATYTESEYPSHRGWGHSTWQEGAALAREAGVGTYVPFHHDPSHDDVFMAEVERAAQDVFANTIVAREGLTLKV